MKYKGLNSKEAESSRQKYGSNTIGHKKREGFLKQFINSMGDPIIKILIAALAINVIVTFRNCDWFETVGIALAIFIATLVSTLSEYGSEAAFLKLQEDADKITARVIRAGNTEIIPSSDIVVGDIVLLQAGEKISADGIIIDGKISVDQSSLNGESKEAVKFPSDTPFEAENLSNPRMLFSSCTVTSGEAVMEVKSVGVNTLYGTAAKQVQEKTRESPLKIRLGKLADTISRIGYAAAVIVALADLFDSFFIVNNFDSQLIINSLCDARHVISNLLHAVTLAITVIVVAVPEGLPMMITVVLSSNMLRMVKDKVLVRKLVGIETAGSMNILFTDKTGTITKGQLEVVGFLDGRGVNYENIAALKKNKSLYSLVKLSSVFNTGSNFNGSKIIGGNATDRALLAYIPPNERLTAGITKTEFISFDSAQKFSAAKIIGSESLALIKGAPEKILKACTSAIDKNGEKAPFSLAVLQNEINLRASKAERIIALAISEQMPKNNTIPNNLTLIGLACIRDDIRPQAPRAVNEIKNAGISVVMITGDNKATAAAIAKDTGILSRSDELVITSDELSRMSDDEIKSKLNKIKVVARALPQDKSRLVRLSQEAGLVAGMTGDGINDAPALKKADIGFSMGSGTEVAKEAGDIVIIDNNINSISKAVLYGRTIFKSIRKFVVYQLTMNLCAVAVSIIGPLVGIDTPITVIQMLWVNMIMDALGGLAFAGERPRHEFMKEPPKNADEPIINPYMLRRIACMGLFTTALCIAFLKLPFIRSLFRYEQNPIYFLTAFFALFIFCGIFNSFNARSSRLFPFADISRNPSFLIIMSAIAAVQIAFIYFGGSLFRTEALTFSELKFVILTAFLVIPADMICKKIIKHYTKKSDY